MTRTVEEETMKTTLVATALMALMGSTALAGDVRMMWYSDGVEGEVMKDLVARFMAENPGINLILDEVPYKVVQEQLQIQLEAGEGPDIARVTNIKTLAPHWLDLTPYLSDPEYWRTNFGTHADWMREDGSQAITGFMTQLTLTGGFANKTLFDQAGVAMPGAGATWDDWVNAAAEVAASQGTAAAFAIDRSGHRISGPNASFGANYIGADGKPAPVDAGVKEFAGKLVQWVADGKMLKDTWVAASGSTYRAAADDFINATIPFYYSGSWQIANFSTKIGDGFDWVAVGSPCGTAGCSGLAGGAALVAVKYTKNPEEVAKVMEFMAREDIVKEFSERTLFLPAHAGVMAKGGLNWQTEDKNVGPALDKFVAAAGEILPAAAALPSWKWASAYYGAMANRISQVMAGEMALDEAFAKIDSDIAEQVAAAK
jgi:alpha-1,4-digalacturonate transport system substrate-binding protein